MDTRQNILDTALRLFSRKGYGAVSIRDICKAVGIKESSVYYHFTNKREIFSVLLAEFEGVVVSLRQSFNAATAVITEITERAFVAVGLSLLNGFFLNDKVLQSLRMLSIESYVDAEAARLYRRVLFDAPLAHDEAVIGRLISEGFFRDGDVTRMAEEYHAAVLMTFFMYFTCGETDAGQKEQANDRLSALLTGYYRRYRTGKGEGKG